MIVNLLRFWLLSVLLNGLLLAHALAADPPPNAGALTFDYEQKKWSDDSRKVLNATIRGSR